MAVHEVSLSKIEHLRRSLFTDVDDSVVAQFFDRYLAREGNEITRRSPPLAREAFLYGMAHVPGATYQGASQLPAYLADAQTVAMVSAAGQAYLRMGLPGGQPIADTLSSLGYQRAEEVRFPELDGKVAETLKGLSLVSGEMRKAVGERPYSPRDPSLPEIVILDRILIPGRSDQTLRIVD